MFKVRFTYLTAYIEQSLTRNLPIAVLANSLMASIFTVLHAIQLRKRKAAYMDPTVPNPEGSMCYAWGGDLLVVGIIANYAAVAADTFSSELGILSNSSPRLITSLTLRKVPRGTNGGVTLIGLAAGLLGSVIIVTASSMFLPICDSTLESLPGGGKAWTLDNRRDFMRFMVIWGALGSVLDSILGGLFQRSVRDSRSGKIVEGEGGTRVLVSAVSAAAASSSEKTKDKGVTQDDSAIAGGDGPAKNEKSSRKASFGSDGPSRVVESGWDLLDNNDVNFLMAVIMSVGGMAAASWYFDIPIQSVMSI
jgi:uncharacterized membrane protein